MFITFEGLDGSGKTTQIELLKLYLETSEEYKDVPILTTKEPGTPHSEFCKKMRDTMFFHEQKTGEHISPLVIEYLFGVDRLHHLESIVIPFIRQHLDGIILCDRFYDSTYAYGMMEGFSYEDMEGIVQPFCLIEPTETIYLDITPEEAYKRLQIRNSLGTEEVNKYDVKPLEFFENLYEAYNERFERCKDDRRKIHHIECSNMTIEETHQHIKNIFEQKMSFQLSLAQVCKGVMEGG